MALFAISAIAVASASAAAPEFKPGFGCSEKVGTGEYGTLKECETVGGKEEKGGKFHRHAGFTSKSGAGVMLVPKEAELKCKADTDTGKITGPKTVGAVTVTFTGCTGENLKTKAKCEVKSTTPKGAAGEVITKELEGKLVKVGAEVGLLLEPVKQPFVKLKGECLPVKETSVEGSIVGEVKLVNRLAIENEVCFENAVLKAFGAPEVLLSVCDMTFEEAVEVT